MSKEMTATLRRLYRGVDGFGVGLREEEAVNRAGGSSTYGEIMPAATFRMLDLLELGPDDVFADLGCGVGKVVLSAAMNTPAARCIGVELSRTRVARARGVYEQAAREGVIDASKVELRAQSVLRTDLSEVTAAYTCATAFPSDFTAWIVRRLLRQRRPISLVSTQVLDPHPRLAPTRVVRLDMSWKRHSKVYYYRIDPGN